MRRISPLVIAALIAALAATPAAAHSGPSAKAAQSTSLRVLTPATGSTVYTDTVTVTASTPVKPSAAGVEIYVGTTLTGSIQLPIATSPGADGRFHLGPAPVGRFPKGTVRLRVMAALNGVLHENSVSITRSSPPSTFNAFFTGVEATQVIQGPRYISDDRRRTTARSRLLYPPAESSTRVPLVTGKRTVVRVTAMVEGTNNQPVGPLYAVISGYRSGTQLGPTFLYPIAPASTSATLKPINPANIAGSIDAARDEARDNATLSWNFTLPHSWTTSDVDLNIYINEAGPNGEFTPECSGCEDVANTFYIRLDYTDSGRVTLMPWQVRWYNPDGTFIARDRSNLPGFFKSIRQYFPIAETSLLTTSDYFGTIDVNAMPKEDSMQTILDKMKTTTTLDGVDTVEYTGHTSHVGVVSCNLVGLVDASGIGQRPGTNVATLGPPCRPMVPAHEVGHNTGLMHASCSHNEGNGGACESSFPVTHGGIGGVDGFDVYSMTAVPEPVGFALNDSSPHLHDFMSYGNPEWISRTNYLRLLEYLRTHRDVKPAQGLAVASSARPRASSQMVVGGTVDGDAGRITGLYQTIARPPGKVQGGDYRIVVRDAAGKPLEDRRFTPDRDHTGAGTFLVTLPRHDDAARVELLRGDVLLDSRDRSANPPTVKWTDPPVPKPLTETGTRNVAWTADDPEKDRLLYVLQYSRDGGKTWRSIDSGIPGLTYPLDLANLGGTKQGRFRVLASDGFHTVADESDRVFPVPNKAPAPSISTPDTELTTTAGVPVNLVGGAVDVEDGPLTGRRLTWTSRRDGEIGRGETVLWSSPSIGRHVVTLIARDSAGKAGAVDVVVNVVPGALDRSTPRIRDARQKGRRVIVRLTEGVAGANSRRVSLRDARGRAVPVHIAAEPGRRRLVLTPARGRRVVRVVVRRGLTDLAGNRLRPGHVRVRG